MTTKAIEKIVHNLSREVSSLRSLVIGIVAQKDSEGDYKPAFVNAVLKAAKEPAVFEYKGQGSLLKQLKKLK